MHQNSNYYGKKFIISVCVMLLVVGAFYLFVLQPQLETYAYVSEQIHIKQAQLNKGEEILRSQGAVIERAKQISEQLADFNSLFDTEFRQGSALVLIGLKAEDFHVMINNLEPGGIVDKESYLELPLKLGMKGNYSNIRALLGEIENMPNLIEIRSLQISAIKSNVTSELPSIQDIKAINESFVDVKCEILIYSDTVPSGKLHLEQETIQSWRIGRNDPYAKVNMTSGVEINIEKFKLPNIINTVPLGAREMIYKSM